MNAPGCCRKAACALSPASRPAPRRRRAAGILGWMLPGATLALMPKCPLCVAMYVALLTGAGISAAAASWLRTSALILCTIVLLGMALKLLRRLASRERGTGPAPG